MAISRPAHAAALMWTEIAKEIVMVKRIGSGRITALGLAMLGSIGCITTSPDPGPPGPPGPPSPPAQKPIEIHTLSNRADLISGGDALVEIVVPDRRPIRSLHVAMGARDMSTAFAMRPSGRITGMVDGLVEGKNLVTADLGDGNTVSLTIVNHKIGGPVLSGPQVTPFICATPTAQAATATTPASNASGLSTVAFDPQCDIATEVKLYYRTTTAGCAAVRPDPSPPATAPANACFKPFDPTKSAPSDLAMTTTDAGVTVPYIVRVERGTVNRGIYDIAVLFDPTKDAFTTGWKPTAPQAGWNGKVLYSFGASSGQPRQQFRSEQNWSDGDAALARGFLVVDNSQTDSLYNSNRITMTETVMMMKEKIIDTYGEVRYVLSNGCSGGSINQLTMSSIFPGLVDGVQPTCTYPDSESTAIEVSDCALLVNFYNSPAWQTLQTGVTQDAINAKKAAINGHFDQTGCHAWVNTFSNLGRPGNYVPVLVTNNVTGATAPVGASTNNCGLPAAMVYDPVKNPTGTRCTGSDHDVSILGTVAGTNRAQQINDNVGVQYGLKALQAGTISAEEFVTLNEKIGGVDFDDNFVATRTVADIDALETVYRAGIISDGKQLSKTPIIDLRGFDDSNIALPGALGIHHTWRSFALRARLDAANGNHNNHVMWRYGTGLIAPAASGLTLQSFLLMDQWVAAIKADTSDNPISSKIAKARPPAAFDFCFLSSDTTFSNKITDPTVCDTDKFLKPHSSPRQVAGGPLAENVLKCQLRPLNRADYAPAVLTDAQFARLGAAFPRGVCDFTKPGVGQEPAVSPLDFSAGPRGQVLPPAPVSGPDQTQQM